MSLFVITPERWAWPAAGKPRRVWWATVRCPGCDTPSTLSKSVHAVAPDGTVTPSYVCPHKPCTFHEWVRLEDWSEPPEVKP